MKIQHKKFQKCTDGSYEWKLWLSFEPKFDAVLFLVYNPHYIDDGNYYATAILRTPYGSKHYGFSNYYNTFKYILEALKVDLKKLDSDDINIEPYHKLSDEDCIKLKKFEL